MTDGLDWHLDALVNGDPVAAWSAAGFSTSDAQFVTGTTTIRCLDDGSGGDRWVLTGPSAPSSVDGIATSPGARRATMTALHPNRVIGLDHVVVASPDLDRTTEAFDALGIECRRVREVPTGGDPMQQRFFRLSDTIVELIGPAVPSGDGPARIWGYAFTTEDIDEAKAVLGDLLSDPKPAVQRGRRIATLRTRDVGIALPVVLLSPHPGHH